MTNSYVFVFIHGACHGKWCFDKKLIPLFEKNHYKTITFDLPGSGDDVDTPFEEVNLKNYTQATLSVIKERTDEKDKIILVAHSLGGMTATLVADCIPERIHYVVYITAFYLPNGEKILDIGRNDLFYITDDGKYINMKPEDVKYGLYDDCDDDDIEFVKSKLRDQSITPLLEASESNGAVKKLNKCYIETTQDNSVPPAVQQKMYTNNIDHVVKMNTSHSPFFSKPNELFNILVSLINE
ncbi:unnamed protein product [Cunninghamella blakesleeana]